jgi:hypothetical protein
MHKLCQECLRNGKVEPATLTHHVNEYRENFSELDFWRGPFEVLCFKCHQVIHNRGIPTKDFRTDIGPDGYPEDPAHPFWVEDRKQQEREKQWTKPTTKR